MNHQQPKEPQSTLFKIIKTLHNQQKLSLTSSQYEILTQYNIYQSILKLLNIATNSSLAGLSHNKKDNNKKKYFQRDQYIITDPVKKIGQIIKVLAGLIDFKDSRQKELAEFNTIRFYQQVNKILPVRFIDFLKGIFPKMNVHKDNVPLYMPFYNQLESYYPNIVGNSNWQSSRQALDFIYKNQILGEGVNEQNWYLLLTCNTTKISQIYSTTSIQKLWALLYEFYYNLTIKPYKTHHQRQLGKTQGQYMKQTIKLLKQLLCEQKQGQIIFIFSIILFILQENLQQLKSCYKNFKQYYNYQWDQYKNNGSISTDNIWTLGLMNSYFHQLFINQKQFYVNYQKCLTIQINQLEKMMRDSLEINMGLVRERIPYHDFFLRIFYPAYSVQNMQRDQEILKIFVQQILKDGEQYQFPQYPYEPELFKQLSKVYFQKYPQKMLQYHKYLDNQTAIFHLLNSKQLTKFNIFIQIKDILSKNKKPYIQQINKKIKITQKDYQNFIKIWQQFHQIFNLKQSKDYTLVKKQIYKIKKSQNILIHMINEVKFQQQFSKHIYLPLKQQENVLMIMEFLIYSYEEAYLQAQQDEKNLAQLLKTYNDFILWPQLKTSLLQNLSAQQYNQMWQKWSMFYLTDDLLVDQLIGRQQNVNQNVNPIIEEPIQEINLNGNEIQIQ